MRSPEMRPPTEFSARPNLPEAAPSPEAERRAERDAARRLLENGRSLQLARSMEANRELILAERDAAERIRLLTDGVALARKSVGNPGCNQTECLVLADPHNNTKQVTSFVKRAVGERAMRYDSETDSVYVARREFDEDGNLVTRWEIDRHSSRDSGVIESLRSREEDSEQTRRDIAAAYDIDPEDLPLDKSEYGARNIEVGHSVKAEVAASVIDDAVGFGCIAKTAMRGTERSLGSAQEAVDGYPPSIQVYKEVVRQGPDHPAFRSLTRLACMDYLLKSTDRSPNNTFYDDDARKFRGIDNGYSLGYSRKNADGQLVPADPLVSVPMEMLEADETWTLDDEARKSLARMLRDVLDHDQYASGQLTPEQAAKLKPEVRDGVMFKMLGDAFSLLYERLDGDGEVIPATRKIAAVEAQNFLLRAKRLAFEGRPPQLSEDEFQRTGFGALARLP